MRCYCRFFLLHVILFSCLQKPQKDVAVPVKASIIPVVNTSGIEKYHDKPEGDYISNKQKVIALQKALKNKYQRAKDDSTRQLVLNEAEKSLTECLIKNI